MTLDKEILESDDFKAAVKAAVDSEVAGLKANRDDALADKAKARDLLAKFGDITPEEAKKLAAEKKKAEEEAARAVGDFDTLKAKLEKDHQSQVEQMATERDGYKTSLEELLIEKAAVDGITEAKGFPKVLKPHVVEKMKLIQGEDGKHMAVILDDNGQPRLRKEAKTAVDYMPVSEFVASLKNDDEFSHAFQGSGASGGATNHRVEHGGKSSREDLKGVTFV